MNYCLMFCCCILRLENINTIQWFEWILSLRGLYKLAQIELVIEGARICTRDGYVPERIRTRDGYVPARIRTRNGYVPVTALQTVEASWPAYRHTISLISVYDRPSFGVQSSCFRRTMIIIIYSRVKLSNRL